MGVPSAGRENPPTRPTVSVVISTRDRPVDLRNCVASVTKSLGPHDEIIIVDSASLDRDVVPRVADDFSARHYRCELPGAARARNLGVSHSGKQVIAFTDDDALVAEDWLDALLAPLSDVSVGAVVGPVFQLGIDPPRLLIEFAPFDAATDRASFNRRDKDWFDRLRLGAIGSGTNFAVRRELFDRHGPFRECLGAGAPIAGDEIFFFLSLVAGGETIVNEPRARVFHPAQLEGRFDQIAQSGIAYKIYAALKHPLLAPQLGRSIVRRLFSPQPRGQHPSARQSSRARAVLNAPTLLLAAWRFGRGG